MSIKLILCLTQVTRRLGIAPALDIMPALKAAPRCRRPALGLHLALGLYLAVPPARDHHYLRHRRPRILGLGLGADHAHGAAVTPAGIGRCTRAVMRTPAGTHTPAPSGTIRSPARATTTTTNRDLAFLYLARQACSGGKRPDHFSGHS